jgi:glycerol-1-phosphate dehydrogenase [NAD(P)+]
MALLATIPTVIVFSFVQHYFVERSTMSEFTFDAVFGQTIECACGKTHHIDPQHVIYGEDALTQLPEVLSEYATGRQVVLLVDIRTRLVAGEAAAGRLRSAGWEVTEILVPDPAEGEWPVCDDHTHDWLLRQIETADFVLSVGSGVLSDLGKWIAFDIDVASACFATAASMNGYASANVAATLKGVKSLVRARPAMAVLSDPAVLREAPYELTAAGLGDILAKSVSSADWRMNHVLFGDYYCERSVTLVAELEPLYLDHPEDLRRGRPDAMEALFRGLLLTGVAMTMAETSAPASGGEHLISHTLDMLSSLDGVPHDLHGRQVGIGTILASEVYRRILNLESPDFSSTSMDIDRAFWGEMADEVENHFAPKVERLHRAVEILSQGDSWDRLREQVKPLVRSPERTRDCLERAGAAYRAEDIGCSRARLLRALLHAHGMRSRFTCIDLARLVGVLPEAAAEIVEEWT